MKTIILIPILLIGIMISSCSKSSYTPSIKFLRESYHGSLTGYAIYQKKNSKKTLEVEGKDKVKWLKKFNQIHRENFVDLFPYKGSYKEYSTVILVPKGKENLYLAAKREHDEKEQKEHNDAVWRNIGTIIGVGAAIIGNKGNNNSSEKSSTRWVSCSRCGGSGNGDMRPDRTYAPCKKCNGQGKVEE